MNAIAEYDISGLNYFVSALNGVLTGTGANEGDSRRLVRTEAGQLAWEISEQLGPKTRAKGLNAIDRDIKNQMTILPRYSNLDEDQQYSATADFTWLTAGPHYILGINDEDDQRTANTETALAMYYAGRRAGGRGNAYIDLGVRGRQSVLRLNRIRVNSATFNSIRRSIKAKVGRMRATFAATAARLIPRKRIPGWIREQIGPVESSGKTLFNDVGLNHPTEPYIEFGSRARGVTSNPVVADKIHKAVERRKYLMVEKLKKILLGYKYDWETGRVFKPQVDEAADQ